MKKKQGKYLPILPDEFNLLTMTEEEWKRAEADFKAYREKYAFRKRYKDLKSDSKNGKILLYSYPIGAKKSAFMKELQDVGLSQGDVKPITIVQKLSDVNDFYQ